MLKHILSKLDNSYGPQYWWPTTSDGELIPRYQGGPVNARQKLEVIFGTILTQNTSWKNAEKAIIELNRNDLIDPDKIMMIDDSSLAKIIRSSGYHNQKAKKIREMCLFLRANPIKDLEKIETPILRDMLLTINGVGKETADSILLYAFQRPVFVIDSYTKRIFSRIGVCSKDIAYDELQAIFEEKLDEDKNLFNQYHALIVEHAKRSCMKVPLCDGCIINNLCKKRI